MALLDRDFGDVILHLQDSGTLNDLIIMVASSLKAKQVLFYGSLGEKRYFYYLEEVRIP